MKKLSLIIILFLSFACVNAQRTYALLAGVSNYGNEETNLHNTTKDVKELRQVLKNQKAVVSVVTSRYATYDNIKEKLNTILKVAKAEDNIIFYFSGHGSEGNIVVYGPEYFQYSELVSTLSTAKTNKVFIFIDACKSGSVASSAGSGYSLGQQSGNKLTFFMSSRSDEFSLENQWLGNGFFTQALIKGLRGKADSNGDRKITVAELYQYIYRDVTKRTSTGSDHQHPQLIGPKSNFNVVLAKW